MDSRSVSAKNGRQSSHSSSIQFNLGGRLSFNQLQRRKAIDQENQRMFSVIKNAHSSIKRHLETNFSKQAFERQLKANGKYTLAKKAQEKAKIIVWEKLNKQTTGPKYQRNDKK